jgi:hypothetical protein
MRQNKMVQPDTWRRQEEKKKSKRRDDGQKEGIAVYWTRLKQERCYKNKKGRE